MTDFGLAGGVHTKDRTFIARAMRGQIYVNSYFSTGMIEFRYRWKESGIRVAGFKKYMISKTTFVNR